jgi:NADPH-dependent methylglyoxal reductase
VDDVASIHIKALAPSVPGNERYLFHAKGLMVGDSVANFAREKYPQLKSRVPEGAVDASAPPNLVKTDISKANAVFGYQWKDWRESVSSMVDDILAAERDGRVG